MGAANAEILTTIITGGVTIVAAIVAFAASCKNGNNVTRQSKSDLQLEHKDMKDTLQSHISSSQNSVENKVNSVKEIINVEIAKSEERRKNLTPEQITINQVAEQIKDMHSNWLESNAKIKTLETEKAALYQKVYDLDGENRKLNQQLKELKSESEQLVTLKEKYNDQIKIIEALKSENQRLKQETFAFEAQTQGVFDEDDEEIEP